MHMEDALISAEKRQQLFSRERSTVNRLVILHA